MAARRHLLVLHEDAPSLLHAKRAFEADGGVRVTGARRSGTAIRRIEQLDFVGVLLHWTLPRHDALKFLCRLHDEIPKVRRPPVLAFVEVWRGADLRRALQLGVDAVLTTPLRAVAVRAELEAIERDGEGISVPPLLAHASKVLLRHDASLWTLDLPSEWLDRMIALPALLREKRTGVVAHPPAVVTVVAALADDLGEDVDVDRLKSILASSMREVFEVDTERLRALLPPEVVIEPLSDAAKARLRTLRGVVSDAVDYVKLLQLKRWFAPLLELCPELDYAALRRLLPELPESLPRLSAEALERLRVLAALLSKARHPTRVVEAWIHREQPTERETEVLDRLLSVLAAEEARHALWSALAGPEVTPDDVRAHLEANELGPALRTARALSNDERQKPALLNNIGLSLRGSGEYDQAESAYRDALRLRPGSPSLLFNLAVVKHDMHAYAEALDLVSRVLERTPGMERALRLKAELESL